ncbi:hypothetical protein ACNVED_12965 [Legionella sp. D16C41]|uniref:hypothetical protein n=1 Tax=Legionella sp. D16C41 TaxID=3402688 RepID=UPI003AF79EE0
MALPTTITEYSQQSLKKNNVWEAAILPLSNTIVEGSTKYVPISQIGFPSCRIDSNSTVIKNFLNICEAIREENTSDLAVISKIQLLVSQTLNLFPTDKNFMGRDYKNPTREKINQKYALQQQHCTFFSGIEDKAAPLSEYLIAKTADCRATNLLFALALKHVGFDVKWAYVQVQRAKVDSNGVLSELNSPHDHAIVLWNPPDKSSLIVLDSYCSEYHGYRFEDLQKGIDRNQIKRFSMIDKNSFIQTLHLYHGYEQHNGGETGKPDRIYSNNDNKNFSGIWKVNDYPLARVIEQQPVKPIKCSAANIF